MNITLDGDWEQYIQEQVSSGKYSSTDEVIHQALRLMREQEQKRDELRREVAIGIEQADQGLATEFNDSTLQHIKANARQRMQSP